MAAPATMSAQGGTFGGNSNVGIHSITDGTSNTIVVGERAFKELTASRTGFQCMWAGIRGVDSTTNAIQYANSYPLVVCNTLTKMNNLPYVNGAFIGVGTLRYVKTTTGPGTGPGGIIDPAAVNAQVGAGTGYENSGMGKLTAEPLWHGFGSVHAGGAQFLLGDGSVRFINETIDRTLYGNLGTIADGNPIGKF